MAEAEALVYEENAELAEKVRKALQRADCRVRTTGDRDRFWRTYFTDGADLVLYDVSGSQTRVECKATLNRLRSSDPSVGVVLLTLSYSGARKCLADEELQNPFLEVVSKPLRSGELPLRILRLMKLRETLIARDRAAIAGERGGHDAGTHVAPSLHDAESGRIDAKKVSEFFGLPLAELARLIGKSRAALHKSPDAVSNQKKLALFVSIASALLRIMGSPAASRTWLSSPNPELEGELPITLIREGHGPTVDELLRDSLLGQPS